MRDADDGAWPFEALAAVQAEGRLVIPSGNAVTGGGLFAVILAVECISCHILNSGRGEHAHGLGNQIKVPLLVRGAAVEEHDDLLRQGIGARSDLDAGDHVVAGLCA